MSANQGKKRIRELERIKKIREIEAEIADGNFKNINFFLENSKREGIDYALELASYYGNLYLVKKIMGMGANVNVSRCSALNMASQNGHFDVVEYLIESGTINNLPNYDILISAVENNHKRIVEYLLSDKNIFGIKLCDVNAEYDLALRTAIEKENLDMVKLLVGCGANINALDKIPLILASKLNDKTIYNYLSSI